jgi:hypothetical protein
MPITKNIRHITRKRKNRNFAIPAAADAMPVNPNNAATSAITRKITAQRNILITSPNYYAAAEKRARRDIEFAGEMQIEAADLQPRRMRRSGLKLSIYMFHAGAVTLVQ